MDLLAPGAPPRPNVRLDSNGLATRHRARLQTLALHCARQRVPYPDGLAQCRALDRQSAHALSDDALQRLVRQAYHETIRLPHEPITPGITTCAEWLLSILVLNVPMARHTIDELARGAWHVRMLARASRHPLITARGLTIEKYKGPAQDAPWYWTLRPRMILESHYPTNKHGQKRTS